MKGAEKIFYKELQFLVLGILNQFKMLQNLF